MYSISEFSRICGLSVKALRLYHDKGLLVPSLIDKQSSYRYYDHNNVERARIILALKQMDFSLKDITEILANCSEEADALEFFKSKRQEIILKIKAQRNVVKQLDLIIENEKEAKMALGAEFEVEEKKVDKILVAGVRFKGKYSDVGEKFARIGKKMGRYINGKAIGLYYEAEYKEENADIEACFPVRKGSDTEDVKVHELEGGKAVSLIHKGPYENSGFSKSYEKLFNYIEQKGYAIKTPIREIYIKGPGMIFKGNPRNYLTEIQILID